MPGTAPPAPGPRPPARASPRQGPADRPWSRDVKEGQLSGLPRTDGGLTPAPTSLGSGRGIARLDSKHHPMTKGGESRMPSTAGLVRRPTLRSTGGKKERRDAPDRILSGLDMGCGRVVRCSQFRGLSDGVGMGSFGRKNGVKACHCLAGSYPLEMDLRSGR